MRARIPSVRSSCASAAPRLVPISAATRSTISWSINCQFRYLARRVAISPPALPYSREMVMARIRLMVWVFWFMVVPSCALASIIYLPGASRCGDLLCEPAVAKENVGAVPQTPG